MVPMKNIVYKLLPSITVLYCLLTTSCSEAGNAKQVWAGDTTVASKPEVKKNIDTTLYKALLQHLSDSDKSGRWPVRDTFPLAGAILSFNRLIASYGNLYLKKKGILGELPKDSMFKKLQGEVAKWQKADTMVHVIPALHYIAVTAQGSPGAGNTYRLRMPFAQIDKVISWASEINALVFLDIQVGLSTIDKELPLL